MDEGTPQVRLAAPSLRRAKAFLEAVHRSRRLHGRWAHPPTTLVEYTAYVRRFRKAAHRGHLVCTEDDQLAGVININEIVGGVFCSGYLGYYAFAPHHGKGYMRAGLTLVLDRAFGPYRLHRLEANVQPGNRRSIALVQGLGFRREGYSPRYLNIDGRWRDHTRWAITAEEWTTSHERE